MAKTLLSMQDLQARALAEIPTQLLKEPSEGLGALAVPFPSWSPRDLSLATLRQTTATCAYQRQHQFTNYELALAQRRKIRASR